MTKDTSISMDQLESILENSPTTIIISALEDRELLYANKAARSGISPECRGRRLACYQAFGYDQPCPTCPAGTVGQGKSSLRELFNPENGHTYRYVGKDIDWAGRPAHIEYISDISQQKLLEQELDHLVNSIPGGIASYEVREGRFIPVYFSDGVMELSGHTGEEYHEMAKNDALDVIYEADRERVMSAAARALERGEVLDVSYRMRHKNGRLIWIHLNGRQMKASSANTMFYAVFTGMSSESRLYQNITNETADTIYVVAKDTFELLYVNETDGVYSPESDCLGETCYAALHHRKSPCEFCGIMAGRMDGEECEIKEDGTERIIYARSRETDWNGIPAYVKYIRDVTETVQTRREKERLDLYFRSIVEQFPGGISMMAYYPDGTMKPEFISPGFAAMMQRTVEETRRLYDEDIFAGIHPDDVNRNLHKLREFLKSGKGPCELIARMQRKDGKYLWTSSMLSMLPSSDEIRRIYIVYTDITKTIEEQEKLRYRYEEQLLEHYHKTGANELILGHSNITRNRVVEMRDSTNSALVKRFGTRREAFFRGLAGLIMDKEDRKAFLKMYLNEPLLEAYAQNRTEQAMSCFIRLPEEKYGRFVQFKVNLLTGPEAGEIIGILTVTDITEETISERIFHQLSVTSHDFVVDVDLLHDSYTILAYNEGASYLPALRGCHSGQAAEMAGSVVLPKDSRQFTQAVEAEEMRRRLKKGPYTITFSTANHGDIRIKNMTVASIEPLLERYCMVCTDITDSVREQQGLLHMMAYTFELMGLLEVGSGSVTMYTRKMVLENLPPDTIDDYTEAVGLFTDHDIASESAEDVQKQFRMESILERLKQEPLGYDFVAACQCENGLRYKQFSMLWGNRNHDTVCVVRADVTDMIASERRVKKELEQALADAEAANEAKSNFLSSMSHDIRTPMNAIVGMTTLAFAHIDDRVRLEDCLQKITVSSRHLLSLVNDVLDMSRIEQSRISLNHMKLLLPDIVDQLTAILAPQAREKGVLLSISAEQVTHTAFYGDSLRMNQVLINLLGNAVKFTPAGGRVDFLVEETVPEKTAGDIRYRFTVQDTGIGMSEEFLKHIFEPFTREQTVERIEGTGLGLSIAKRLVDLMGGKISVESSLGQGSRFTVELEFEAADHLSAVHTDGGEISDSKMGSLFTGRRFLIAEDNELNSEILCELLHMEGALSELREDGAAAVEAFKAAVPGTYDVILMDIQMPGMNGYEAARMIRSLNRADAGKIPIIAMTANAFAEDVQAALEAGMNAHVAKPIDMELLRAALARVLK
ncbi:PAS domain-containing hybrid sensor histidine kinase/response regulator [uncultured Clostridium sp.]|uniref:PAS domain-containing hybrid sensor histidine kinase/response regulator n=1 Tax=uncultured Clostridium sp. TaxID=59620 RepID=UPI0025CED658|nr:PAS domain-containing hybrid sensor histidine kinase/response regulator [uncultured Clostridium sp.]